MTSITIREPKIEDKNEFIAAMQRSKSIHHPWVKAPTTGQEFDEYFQRYLQSNQKSFLICNQEGSIVGIFNINEIVRGLFQNAYLGFYVVADYAGKGYMSAGLKLVLSNAFNDLKLHRLEANIQPDNSLSIQLIKKNGFRYEGFSPRYLKIDNEWRGHEHWAITYEEYIRNDADVLKKDHIDIVAYDPEWPLKASNEINKLRAILPASTIIDIQHVGSTAIPGMAAKPIVDIQIAARSLEEMKIIAIPVLQKIGYEYWYDNPDSERMFFVKGMPPYGEKRTHHVHIFELSSKHWSGKILFRDYLIAHPEIASEYQELKIKFAQQYTHDREKYTNAKGKFVDRIIKLAQKLNIKKI
jgi:GrpB-like predicted nucleotidyltransferase (UPF0157 family)/RimJ/RimL family protein N-acetyltransferase